MEIIEELLSVEHRDIFPSVYRYFDCNDYHHIMERSNIFCNFLEENEAIKNDFETKKRILRTKKITDDIINKQINGCHGINIAEHEIKFNPNLNELICGITGIDKCDEFHCALYEINPKYQFRIVYHFHKNFHLYTFNNNQMNVYVITKEVFREIIINAVSNNIVITSYPSEENLYDVNN